MATDALREMAQLAMGRSHAYSRAKLVAGLREAIAESDELLRLLRLAYEAHSEHTRGFAGSTQIRDILERGGPIRAAGPVSEDK